MIRLTSKARQLLDTAATRQAVEDELPTRFPRACIVYARRKNGEAWIVRARRKNVAEYTGHDAKRLAGKHRDQLLNKPKH